MKKHEIIIGRTYSNGNGRMREVLDIGDYPLYSQQSDRVCVMYRQVINGRPATRGNMTLASFATWAKNEVID